MPLDIHEGAGGDTLLQLDLPELTIADYEWIEDSKTYRLVFEVWVKDIFWAGDAVGEWLHDWRLYEVHFEDQPCVFPSTAYGCVIASGG